MYKRKIALFAIGIQLLLPAFTFTGKLGKQTVPAYTTTNFPALEIKKAEKTAQLDLQISSIEPVKEVDAKLNTINNTPPTQLTDTVAQEEPVVTDNQQQEKKSTTVRFDEKRAEYTPITEFVPDQARFGIGYEAVIAEIASFDPTKNNDAKALNTLVDRTGKAIRDIHFFLNTHIEKKQLKESSEMLAILQSLAIMAYKKGALPEEIKRANVVAWVKKHSDEINKIEDEYGKQISTYREYQEPNTTIKQLFDWQKVAIDLGLKDDYQQAIIDFGNLDPVIAKNNNSQFVQTANSLITYLTQRASNATTTEDAESLFNVMDRTLNVTVNREIIAGPTQLIAAYREIEKLKRKNKKEISTLLKKGLATAAYLTSLENQIRSITTENYSNTTVKALGNPDGINYKDISAKDLHSLLEEQE